MKKLILFIGVLLLGVAVKVRAEGDNMITGGGWNVDIVTGNAAVISTTRVKLRKIILSSGVVAGLGDFLIAYSTPPNVLANGADGQNLLGGPLFWSTAAVTPPLVYKTTGTVSGNGDNLSNSWGLGDCENCYVDLPGLYIRQSNSDPGQALKAAIYYKR